MSKFDQVIQENIERRQRRLDGKLNCLPFPFDRMRTYYPGLEQGKFVIITANQKVGKSKLADYIFVYEPLFYAMEHPELKVKVLYFSLEISEKEKLNEFMCHLLFRLDRIHVDTRLLRSVDRTCDSRIHDLLKTEKYQKYLRAYEDMVIVNDTDKNPTGINKKCREYALAHGHWNYKETKEFNEVTGEWEDSREIDSLNPYTQDDEEEYRIIILDNAANLTQESGLSKSDNIELMSKYGIDLKKRLKFIFVLIQHQMQAQESVENIKYNRTKPTADGLGDCKTTCRDLNCMIGLYNPAKFLKENKETYLGYNVKRLGQHCRILEIIDDRDYGANGRYVGLFFDGAASVFHELPLPSNTEELERFYQYAENMDNNPDTSAEEFTLSN